jgi:hypothetical protein
MDEELTAIATAGAAAAASTLTAALRPGMRTAMSDLFRWMSLRREKPDDSAPDVAPASSTTGTYTQTNTACGRGNVFAVQHGALYVRQPVAVQSGRGKQNPILPLRVVQQVG